MTSKPGNIGFEAFARREWTAAYEALRTADATMDLAAADLERYAFTARLTGHDEEFATAGSRAHQAYLAADDPASAARCAFWLGFGFMERGEMAQAGGWLARANRILAERDLDCAARGYLSIPEALQLLDGDAAAALATFDAIADCGQRFGDVDLVTIGRLGGGQALIRLGRTHEGATRLDEVMVGVLAGEVSAIVAGIAYCSVVEACHEMFDLRRAQEWTAALTAWCDSQPDLVPFRGNCLVYRAEVMQRQGEWQAAIEEVRRAGALFGESPGLPAAGSAHYCQGELHRLRGHHSEAETAFRRAEECGRRPEPGLALLRLAQGRTDAAATAIRHALNETEPPAMRAGLLPAAVEILVAAADVSPARELAEELERYASSISAEYLVAAAEHGRAQVLLAEGNEHEALRSARHAVELRQALGIPYETARSRELLADVAHAIGDDETARIQLAAARETYERLGAAYDLTRLGSSHGEAGSELTPREMEVLRLVATGMTNRAIANHLVISEKTAANHVSSILSKLALSSRAAATAYAYERGLV